MSRRRLGCTTDGSLSDQGQLGLRDVMSNKTYALVVFIAGVYAGVVDGVGRQKTNGNVANDAMRRR